jgi:hypothetical protein
MTSLSTYIEHPLSFLWYSNHNARVVLFYPVSQKGQRQPARHSIGDQCLLLLPLLTRNILTLGISRFDLALERLWPTTTMPWEMCPE